MIIIISSNFFVEVPLLVFEILVIEFVVIEFVVIEFVVIEFVVDWIDLQAARASHVNRVVLVVDVTNRGPDVFAEMAVCEPGTGTGGLDVGLIELGPFEVHVVGDIGGTLYLGVSSILIDIQ
jgi:hypothetical protein